MLKYFVHKTKALRQMIQERRQKLLTKILGEATATALFAIPRFLLHRSNIITKIS